MMISDFFKFHELHSGIRVLYCAILDLLYCSYSLIKTRDSMMIRARSVRSQIFELGDHDTLFCIVNRDQPSDTAAR